MSGQKTKSRNLKIARDLDSKRKRFGFFSLLSLGIAVVCFLGYNLLVTTGTLSTENSVFSMATYVAFAVFAAVVGTCTYKWSAASSSLKGHLHRSGLTKDDL